MLGLAVAGLRGPTGQAQSPAEAVPGEACPGHRPRRLARERRLRSTFRSCRQKPRCCSPCNRLLCSSDDELKALVARHAARCELAKAPVCDFARGDRTVGVLLGRSSRITQGSPADRPFIPPPSGIMIRSTKAQDWKSRLTDQFARAQELRLDGQTCYRLGQPPIPGWCAFAPDDRTLVLAGGRHNSGFDPGSTSTPAPTAAGMKPGTSPATGMVIAAIETRWLRRRLAQAAPPGGPDGSSPFGVKLDTIAPLLEKAQAYVISMRRVSRDQRSTSGR